MSFIQPNSDIKLLHNVPLDMTQEHSIIFDNTTAQYNYFSSLAKFSFADYSYQRVNIGVIKVEKCADDIYDCNYLMFRNTSFGSRWFYAFITKIEYINNVTSAVYYELDVLQSWLFDFDTEECFVEREMPVTDYANEHLVPECLETGEYVVSHQKEYDSFMTPLKICILTTNVIVRTVEGFLVTDQSEIDFAKTYGNPTEQTPSGFRVADIKSSHCNNLPVGVCPLFFPNNRVGRNNIDWYNKFLQVREATDSVISMFLVPSFISGTYTYKNRVTSQTIECSVIANDKPYKISRQLYVGAENKTKYQNKNMKLYNYPYSFAFISDGNGNMQIFKPELFQDKSDYFNFTVQSSVGSSAEMIFVPNYYKGMNLNFNESYVFNKFPQISWTTDFFKEYWAQNKVNITSSILGDMLSGANGIANGQANFVNSGGYIQPLAENYRNIQMGGQFGGNYSRQLGLAKGLGYSGAIQSGLNIAQTLGNVGIMYHASDKNHGVQSTDTMASKGNCRVYSGTMSVTAEMGKVIDEYFTRFGYATHLTKVPNWRTGRRPHWNYVKTISCVIRGSLPQEDAEDICSIFDNGITWWRNGNEIGNYSLDNRPSARGQYRP